MRFRTSPLLKIVEVQGPAMLGKAGIRGSAWWSPYLVKLGIWARLSCWALLGAARLQGAPLLGETSVSGPEDPP